MTAGGNPPPDIVPTNANADYTGADTAAEAGYTKDPYYAELDTAYISNSGFVPTEYPLGTAAAPDEPARLSPATARSGYGSTPDPGSGELTRNVAN